MPLLKVAFRPGIVKTESPYGQEGRWQDGMNVRFVAGQPQKMGGFRRFITDPLKGVCRGTLVWQAGGMSPMVAFGTHLGLFALRSGRVLNITPLRLSGTLSNPFVTTAGSDVVTVNHVNHGGRVGDVVIFSDAAAVGGLDMNGEWVIASVSGTDAYTIKHTAQASGAATGGGAAVGYKYEISPGKRSTVILRGFGTGLFGTGRFGVPRESSQLEGHARTWSLDNWGAWLLACPNGGNIYKWDPEVDERAVLVPGAPTQNGGILVTDTRELFVWGADGNRNRVMWSDRNDFSNFVVDVTTTANERMVQDATNIVGAIRANASTVLVFTERSVVGYQQTGLDFSSGTIADEAGLIGPLAAASLAGRIYWMGSHDFFSWEGYVNRLPSEDIRSYVFNDMNRRQRHKFHACPVPQWAEVWFYYCSAESDEIDRCVVFNTETGVWSMTDMLRTSAAPAASLNFRPIASDVAGMVYIQETDQDADDSNLKAYVESAPFDIGDGDVLMDIFRIIPDFHDQRGDLSITLKTRDYPRSRPESVREVFSPGDEALDVRTSGRQVAVRIESDARGGHFRMGGLRLDIQPGGARR